MNERSTRLIVTLAVGALLAVPAIMLAAQPATPEASNATPAGDMQAMGGMGAAYMQIANGGSTPDRLIGGKTGVAQIVEIHEMLDVAGVMQMHPLPDGLEIPNGGSASLEPGGFHVMLIGLTQDLKPGMTYELTLDFEQAGEVTLQVPVEPAPPSDSQPELFGDLTITGQWTRPAPALGAPSAELGTPVASPAP